MRRAFWMTAGAVLGAYGTTKARKAAYRLSAPGLADQAAALGVGWREFRAELDDGVQRREHHLVHGDDRARLDPATQKELPC